MRSPEIEDKKAVLIWTAENNPRYSVWSDGYSFYAQIKAGIDWQTYLVVGFSSPNLAYGADDIIPKTTPVKFVDWDAWHNNNREQIPFEPIAAAVQAAYEKIEEKEDLYEMMPALLSLCRAANEAYGSMLCCGPIGDLDPEEPEEEMKRKATDLEKMLDEDIPEEIEDSESPIPTYLRDRLNAGGNNCQELKPLPAKEKKMPGYHLVDINKGEYGSVSKIEEEMAELKDALQQGNKVMALVELADMIGAIRGYLEKEYAGKMSLQDLIEMANATDRAFKSGCR